MPLHEFTRNLQDHKFENEDGKEYEATTFGGFDQYFANKLVKLQNQAQEDTANASTPQSTIFKDCVIYITGYTNPPAQELKRLITTNGGIMCHYLAGKSYATHILATNLTARKKVEYSSYKVVTPNWVVDSVNAGKRLAWHKYRVVTEPANQMAIGTVGTANSSTNSTSTTPMAVNCLDPGFIQQYYERSRLHHLSVWKADLKRKFQIRAKRSNSKSELSRSQDPPTKKISEPVIMHVDFDSFFVAVSLLKHPELEGKPVCVSNSRSPSGDSGGNGDVASCNYIARRYGVKNGMWLSNARSLCPELCTVPYDFGAYETASNSLYECLLECEPDLLYPVSVDEALLDVTLCISRSGLEPLEFAENLRNNIKSKCMVSASIGMGSNVLLAKIALRLAKPHGQAHITERDKLERLDPIDVKNLPGIGHVITRKLNSNGVYTVGELRALSLPEVQRVVVGGASTGSSSSSKLAQKLYEYARGIDTNSDISNIPPPKSIGVEIAWGIRLNSDDQVCQFVSNLTSELCRRMGYGLADQPQIKGSQMTAKLYKRQEDAPKQAPKYMGHGLCDIMSKSSKVFGSSTNDWGRLTKVATELVMSFQCPADDVRGIGLQMTRLETYDEGGAAASASEGFQPETPRKRQRVLEPPGSGSPQKAARTLTQQMSPSRYRRRDSASRDSLSASPSKRELRRQLREQPPPPDNVDPGVWEQLPLEIRKELAAAQLPPSRFGRNNRQTQETQQEQPVLTVIRPYRPVQFTVGSGTKQHTIPEDQINSHLFNWIRSGSSNGSMPHYDDVVAVDRYLCQVAEQDADWGKAVRTMRLMRRALPVDYDPQWVELLDRLQESVSSILLKRKVRCTI